MSSSESSSSELKKEEDKFPFLQRFPPNINFINLIPSQAQKGFRNIDISFKCIDICEQYVAIGTNIGVVYLYDRQKSKLHKLRNNEYTDPITCVKLLVSLECLVAVGTQKGAVFAFKVPFQDNANLEKFKVEGLHNSTVTSLEWVKNGIKFFSGDSNGVIICTEIDHLEHHSSSKVLLEETSEIVQLSYTNLMLLVSTLERSLLYDFKKNQFFQVGQKDRKSPGNFGATFFHGGFNSTMYLSRPGQKIWKSDESGVISETIILKPVFVALNQNGDYQDFQFGRLNIYFSDFLLTWSSSRIVLINPEERTVRNICKLSNIVDVATCNDEVFVLQGFRNIVRFAVHSESEEQFLHKVEDNGNYLPPMGDFHLVSKIESKHDEDSDTSESNNVFEWMKRKFSEATRDNCKVVSEESNAALPNVVSLDTDVPNVEFSPEPEVPFSSIPIGKLHKKQDDEIVYKKKKKKKSDYKAKYNEDHKKKNSIESLNDDSTNTDNSAINVDNSSMNVDSCSMNADSSSMNVDSCSMNADSSSMNVDSSSMNIDSSSINSMNVSDNSECISNDFAKDVIGSPKTTEALFNTHQQSVAESATSSDSVVDDIIVESSLKQLSLEVSNHDLEVPQTSPDIYSGTSLFVFPKDSTDAKSSESDTTSERSNSGIMSESVESSDASFPKYGVECVQYKSPGLLLSLSASNNHVLCVDSQNCLYISEFPKFGFRWTKIDQPAEQIAVSPSGNVVWILYRGTAFVAARKSRTSNLKTAKWVPVAKSVSSISASDTCVWCITWEGSLLVFQNVSSGVPCASGRHVACSFTVVQVACKDDIVWILTNEGRLFHQVYNSKTDFDIEDWSEVTLLPELSISVMSFGAKDKLYIIDHSGTLWFREGVNSMNPSGVNDIWQVESSAYVYESSSQVYNAVRKVVAANKELLTSFIRGQLQQALACSEAGIWWCKVMDTQIFSYSKFIIGHSWEFIIPSGTVSTTKWNVVAAEGFTATRDVFWGSSRAGGLLFFSLKANNCISVDLPYGASLQCLESTEDALWILTTEGKIYIRREMSEKSPQGIWWQLLDLTQLYDVSFSHISCSCDVVWACDNNGQVFLRLGDLHPPAGATLNQAWIQVDLSLSVSVQKVYVGPKKYMVWAISDTGLVYARRGITSKLHIGEEWLLVPGPRAKQLCVSATAVWLLKYSGKIFRRFGITRNNPTGDYWKQIPGKLTFLSVTAADDLWGIQDSCLCQHSSCTATFERQSYSEEPVTKDMSDDDWEDIAAELSNNEDEDL